MDVLTTSVACFYSGNPYVVASGLKTAALVSYVGEFIVRAQLDTNAVLTAACYLRRLNGALLVADRAPRLCERLAGAALMVADKVITSPASRVYR